MAFHKRINIFLILAALFLVFPAVSPQGYGGGRAESEEFELSGSVQRSGSMGGGGNANWQGGMSGSGSMGGGSNFQGGMSGSGGEGSAYQPSGNFQGGMSGYGSYGSGGNANDLGNFQGGMSGSGSSYGSGGNGNAIRNFQGGMSGSGGYGGNAYGPSGNYQANWSASGSYGSGGNANPQGGYSGSGSYGSGGNANPQGGYSGSGLYGSEGNSGSGNQGYQPQGNWQENSGRRGNQQSGQRGMTGSGRGGKSYQPQGNWQGGSSWSGDNANSLRNLLQELIGSGGKDRPTQGGSSGSDPSDAITNLKSVLQNLMGDSGSFGSGGNANPISRLIKGYPLMSGSGKANLLKKLLKLEKFLQTIMGVIEKLKSGSLGGQDDENGSPRPFGIEKDPKSGDGGQKKVPKWLIEMLQMYDKFVLSLLDLIKNMKSSPRRFGGQQGGNQGGHQNFIPPRPQQPYRPQEPPRPQLPPHQPPPQIFMPPLEHHGLKQESHRCGPNEEYKECDYLCQVSCKRPCRLKNCPYVCLNTCVCKKPLVRRESDNACIPRYECPRKKSCNKRKNMLY